MAEYFQSIHLSAYSIRTASEDFQLLFVNDIASKRPQSVCPFESSGFLSLHPSVEQGVYQFYAILA